jgi:hypothetical protein
MALGDVRAGKHHLCTHRFQVKDLLLAHLVGHHDQKAIAFLRGDQGEAEAGVAGGGFDEEPAGRNLPLPLRGLDHGERDAVLDRSAGVVVFQF